MKTLIGSIMILLLSACARPQHDKPYLQVDAPFTQHFNDFKAQAVRFGHPLNITNLTIEFAKLPDDVGGSCTGGVHPTIRVNQGYWDNVDYVSQEMVIFHELGHCVLGRNHDDGAIRMPDTVVVPKSIMSSVLFESWEYMVYNDYYLAELFNKGKQ